MVVFHHFPINKEGQWDSPIVYIYIGSTGQYFNEMVKEGNNFK